MRHPAELYAPHDLRYNADAFYSVQFLEKELGRDTWWRTGEFEQLEDANTEAKRMSDLGKTVRIVHVGYDLK